MKVVLAAIDGRESAGSILAAGRAMSELLGASLRGVHVVEPGSTTSESLGIAGRAGVPVSIVNGDAIDEIVRALDDPSVLVVVVGARDEPSSARPAGHVAIGIAERSTKPVLVVPPRATVRDGPTPITRALVPLEGTVESAEAVADSMRWLASGGVELIGVHVFEPETVPRFWDEPAHARDAYCAEFLARWCTQPEVDLRLRSGPTQSTVMDVAEAEHVDLIALGWSQDLAPGRALMIRTALATAHVPVLLVPLVTAGSGP